MMPDELLARRKRIVARLAQYARLEREAVALGLEDEVDILWLRDCADAERDALAEVERKLGKLQKENQR